MPLSSRRAATNQTLRRCARPRRRTRPSAHCAERSRAHPLLLQGSFYEGYMTMGDTTDDVDEKVQANIVAVKYGQ